MDMTANQRAVMAHVVIDPDAWLAHAVATFGENVAARHLAAKVARWQPDYDAAVARDGEAYQTRSEREAS